ncbi:1,4-alpha-glucan branching protein GlgB [Acanthopleuribacter pedis]|uniref:1,4-alpha-glucan branching enzyme GlgB n=1 Tax=Acanthopleuribacter pedis TaxID=442870 RepID=A0A8J7U3Y4_9BACT|nr:1,4-alpha-glucan branching protein GlgB [Acanthopleuribacter pedis]MBO1317766.1 1,4-alpha-glucan branching protein GlgB [Acanthopleuribacter pedis]
MTEPAMNEWIDAAVGGNTTDPFAVFGMHQDPDTGAVEVRTMQPGALAVGVRERATGETRVLLKQVHEDGLFAGVVLDAKTPFDYLLEMTDAAGEKRIAEDPYRLGPVLGEIDRHLIGEGNHWEIHQKLGCHLMTHEGVAGAHFAVWAPNAKRVSVVGSFNNWDGRRHAMRLHPGCGVWEIFVPDVAQGDIYKYEILHRDGYLLPLKADPLAFQAQCPPATASVVADTREFTWRDGAWMEKRGALGRIDKPMSVYEVHLGSWRRDPDQPNRFLTYRELAELLVPYVKRMGFTHIELMPINEFPFYGSWGYQPISLFAPTARYGSPQDFKEFIEACHAADIGVILDWVPGHFPSDDHGLAQFDGTHLYEHQDSRQGFHPEWNTLIYNYGRNEVSNFLINNALFWCERFHIDGLRVDAVASMLYLDYARKDGEWIPNEYGDNKNLDAIKFLRNMNERLHERCPGVVTIAEESTSWPGISRPAKRGGLGFDYKWNMGWMHDTLGYMKKDPIHRQYHHNGMTFGLVYAFSENFMLPLSHDEVVHMKGSLLGRMPGDTWQQFANLRAYFGFLWTHPGKKLLFMGGEFGQGREWNHDASLDWHLLDIHWHQGVQRLVADLNKAYQETPALHELDCEPGGFEWVKVDNKDESVFAFVRKGLRGADPVLVVCNFTPLPRGDWRFGVPKGGFYEEIVNSDLEMYGGSNVNNSPGVAAEETPWDGFSHSVVLTLPPLSTLIYRLRQD